MPEQPDRLEREINEILDKIEQFPKPERRRAGAARRGLRRAGENVAARQRAIARGLARISLSQLVLLGFLLILGSFVLRGPGPAGAWIMIAGVVLLVTSFALMLFGAGRRPRTQQWRGRTISYSRDSLAQRVQRWFARRPRR